MNADLDHICILIIDDREADRMATAHECRSIFRANRDALVIDEATGIDEALQRMATRIYQIILLDKDLGTDAGGEPVSGIDHIRLLQEIQPVSKIIMLTASEKYLDVARALKNGAYDYMVKSADDDGAALRAATLRRALQSSMDGIDLTVRGQAQAKDGVYQSFICKSPAMIRFDLKLRAVADSQHPALLLGPSGIGKGAVARRINQFRAATQTGQRPFVNINIGALPDNLAQAELFGQDPYSFTGSGSKTKTGLIDVARNGDIFLDEVGDASPEMQLKLLKVVEEKEYFRVGGRQAIKTNARFIFATNKNIKELVAAGKFREDLYMRIAALELEVPLLSERKEDLLDIIESILERIRVEAPGKMLFLKDFPEDFVRYLTRDSIPGNIRGIQNVLERFSAFADFDRQGYPDYRQWRTLVGALAGSKRKGRDARLRVSELASLETDFFGETFPGFKAAQEVFERRMIEEAIARFGSISKASKGLQLSKATLSVKMKSMNIKPKKRSSHAES